MPLETSECRDCSWNKWTCMAAAGLAPEGHFITFAGTVYLSQVKISCTVSYLSHQSSLMGFLSRMQCIANLYQWEMSQKSKLEICRMPLNS